MTVGIILLAHTGLSRVAQVARVLADGDCRVAVHLDARLPDDRAAEVAGALVGHPHILLAPRLRCEWGTFSLVDAAETTARLLLGRWPEVTHVCQISGSCLPIRPVAELAAFLDAHPDTDFVESVPVTGQDWVVDGLSIERFTLYFPFSWDRHRWLFDTSVSLQRRLGIRRHIPDGIVPHIGSQWWCLTSATIRAILADPALPAYRRYFRTAWIPDETYFQTLARKHTRALVPRSLTYSRFDSKGKPFVYYDDHAEAIATVDAFFLRKIWPGADGLYERFLRQSPRPKTTDDALDRILDVALARQVAGRDGVMNMGRFARNGPAGGADSAAAYDVLEGFAALGGPPPSAGPDRVVHGRLFAGNADALASGEAAGPLRSGCLPGNLPGTAAVRDRDPAQYLARLLWADRGRRQALLFEPDDQPDLAAHLAADPMAHVWRIDDAWLVALWRDRARLAPPALAESAANAARAERRRLAQLCGPEAQATTRRWPLAAALAQPAALAADLMAEAGLELATEGWPGLAELASFVRDLQPMVPGGIDLPTLSPPSLPA